MHGEGSSWGTEWRSKTGIAECRLDDPQVADHAPDTPLNPVTKGIIEHVPRHSRKNRQ